MTNRQLISLLPFVEDPDAELEALEEEKKKNMEDMSMFNKDNTKPEDEVEDEESGVLGEEESQSGFTSRWTRPKSRQTSSDKVYQEAKTYLDKGSQ